MVHETVSNHSNKGKEERCVRSYLWVQLVDPLDRKLYIPRAYGTAYVHALLNGFTVRKWLDVGFFGKFLRRRRVAFIDKIIHDDEIDVSVKAISQGLQRHVCDCCKMRMTMCHRIRKTKLCSAPQFISERFPT